MDGLMGGWIDGWMDGWMNGRMDGWMRVLGTSEAARTLWKRWRGESRWDCMPSSNILL